MRLIKIEVHLSAGPSQIPTEFPNLLAQINYPNPFDPCTCIRWQMPEAVVVDLKVYNLRVEMMRTMTTGTHEVCHHEVVWAGLDQHGSQVASGVYFILLQAGNLRMSSKIFKIHSRGQRLQHVKCIAFLLF